MKEILLYLFEHKTLSREEARSTLLRLAEGEFNDIEITAFLSAYLMRSIRLPELLGFRDALLELCVKADLGEGLIDIVGTGGDGKNSFNISTLSCFLVAGAGARVAKHGNYGMSSITGASNLLQQLGYTFSDQSGKLQKELDQAGICFLHAPLFHPVMKRVAGIRKDLGIRSFFNMLGPLVHPARPAYQLIGVYSNEMARIYNYILQLEADRFTIVHSLDGYDEITLTHDTRVITQGGECIRTPIQLGKMKVSPASVQGGYTVAESAKIFLDIIGGKGTPEQDAVVIANAAAALYGSGKYTTEEEAFSAASESLYSGKAGNCFQKLLKCQS